MTMADEPTEQDRDLLARLNALRKSTIDLDAKRSIVLPNQASLSSAITQAPLSAIQKPQSDLSSRFAALATSSAKSGTPLQIPELQNSSNDKTVEDLIQELGTAEQWNVGKDEQAEVAHLLSEAKKCLPPQNDGGGETPRSSSQEDADEKLDREDRAERRKIGKSMPAVDVSVFQPGKEINERTEDQEANEYLARVMDEIGQGRNPVEGPASEDWEIFDHSDEGNHPKPTQSLRKNPSPSAVDSKDNRHPNLSGGPSNAAARAPAASPPSSVSDLAARFKSLSRSTPTPTPRPTAGSSTPAPPTSQPPNPTTPPDPDPLDALSLPSVPTSVPIPKPPTSTTTPSPHTPPSPSDNPDDWCIICLSPIDLVRCLGCDGDLYCSRCWDEGHRGESAGWEEQRHRAVVFNRGGGVEKTKLEKRRKAKVGVGVEL